MSERNKILTITIPSYNVEKYLPEILPTYLSDEILEDIELLIVNDGSMDGTERIGKEFQEKYPGTIRVVNKENGGHGSTINRGIEEAAGKYFKVIDGDDWVDTKGFVALVNRLKNTDADLIMNPFVRVNVDAGSREIAEVKELSEGKIYPFEETVSELNESYQLHSNTFKTALLKGMRKIDEHCFYVDQEYILYPIDSVKTMEYYDFPVYQYRVGNADQSMSQQNMIKNRDMHKRVILSLLDFYDQEDHEAGISQMLGAKIRKMCQLQIDIYFYMNRSKEVRHELMNFLKEVREKDGDIYRQIPGKKAALLRKTGAPGYDMICLTKKNGV